MSVLRIGAKVSRPGVGGVAEVDVELPMPKNWSPDALRAVLPVLAMSAVAVLRARDPEAVVEFSGGEDL